MAVLTVKYVSRASIFIIDHDHDLISPANCTSALSMEGFLRNSNQRTFDDIGKVRDNSSFLIRWINGHRFCTVVNQLHSSVTSKHSFNPVSITHT